MALTDLCSSSFLIGLAAILLIGSLIMTYVSYRMSEQDHKISSMLGLISTMAQELEFFRNKLANSNGMPGGGAMSNIPFLDTIQHKLINVSDDDLEESESDSDSDSDSGSESDSKPELGFETAGHTNDVKILNINLSSESSFIDISHELQIDHNIDIEKEEEEDDDDDDDDDEEEAEVPSSSDDEIKITEVYIGASSNVIPLSKTVQVDNIDYKKLNVQQLRTIVLQKGLSEEPNKLKKTELLKILSSS